MGWAFRAVHRLLYLTALGALLWHVFLVHSRLAQILVLVAFGLWTLSHLLRIVFRWRKAYVIEEWHDSEVTRLRLRTRRPVSAFPGSYFYLFLPGSYMHYNLIRSSAVMVLWSDPKQWMSGKTTDLHILASRRSRHLRLLGNVEKEDSLLLDGPYGMNLELQAYETVVLTAKGIGIISILPMMLHLAARRSHDNALRSQQSDSALRLPIASKDPTMSVFRDVTRRVDLIWILEDNDQEAWVAKQLQTLQDLDPKNVSCPANWPS